MSRNQNKRRAQGRKSPVHAGSISPEELRRISEKIASRAPSASYKDTYMDLVDVNPEQVMVSWGVSDAELQEGRPEAPTTACKKSFHLRLQQIADDVSPSQVIVPLEGSRGQQYIRINNPGGEYFAELGYVLDGGKAFECLARSGKVALPQGRPSTPKGPRQCYSEKEFLCLWEMHERGETDFFNTPEPKKYHHRDELRVELIPGSASNQNEEYPAPWPSGINE